MAEALLEAEGLAKRFGAVIVADDIALSVAEGECRALIGPNGAGKTTLVGQLCGAVRSDAGTIRFAGSDVTALDVAARARAGLVRTFQITAILPEFTALVNVATAVQSRHGSSFRFFRPVDGERALNDRALELLDRVGLADRAGVPAGALAHGEKRALELAIALGLEPRLLLLDEPMAGAGPEESERLTQILQTLRGSLTMLLVEHDMQAVFALADRVSVMVAGRVMTTDTPDRIRADPAVIAAYLGQEPDA